LDRTQEITPIMGSYGMGFERILPAAVEQDNDANGFWLARPRLRPSKSYVTPTKWATRNFLKHGRGQRPAVLEAAAATTVLARRPG
jgi:prolyl-tRNA synthetase